MATIAAIIGRILLGVLFVFAGLGKVLDVDGTAQFIETSSVLPGSLAMPTGVFEIAAGLILASGFGTRLSALVLIGFTALATLFFHYQVTDAQVAQAALKNLALIGGLAMVFAYAQLRAATRAHDRADHKAADPKTGQRVDRDGDGRPDRP